MNLFCRFCHLRAFPLPSIISSLPLFGAVTHNSFPPLSSVIQSTPVGRVAVWADLPSALPASALLPFSFALPAFACLPPPFRQIPFSLSLSWSPSPFSPVDWVECYSFLLFLLLSLFPPRFSLSLPCCRAAPLQPLFPFPPFPFSASAAFFSFSFQ